MILAFDTGPHGLVLINDKIRKSNEDCDTRYNFREIIELNDATLSGMENFGRLDGST